MAEEEGCTTNALIAKFHDEILAHRGEVPNFASFLRVTSMRYLRYRMVALEKRQTQPLAGPILAVLSSNPSSVRVPGPRALRAPGGAAGR